MNKVKLLFYLLLLTTAAHAESYFKPTNLSGSFEGPALKLPCIPKLKELGFDKFAKEFSKLDAQEASVCVDQLSALISLHRFIGGGTGKVLRKM
jgi:hypothetical protein